MAENLKPSSLNLFIEASSLKNPNSLNVEEIETIETINKTDLNVISFGNGFGYDGPSIIPDTLGIYKNLVLMEINFDTLGSNSFHKIKNRKELAKYKKMDVHKINQRNCDTILESLIDSMKGRPYLV
ncbi:hypothetical protein N9L92_05310, partial [Saprospiraceae bacterium]|nr:hypothetical protein [Saprospiraceae bacterium]